MTETPAAASWSRAAAGSCQVQARLARSRQTPSRSLSSRARAATVCVGGVEHAAGLGLEADPDGAAGAARPPRRGRRRAGTGCRALAFCLAASQPSRAAEADGGDRAADGVVGQQVDAGCGPGRGCTRGGPGRSSRARAGGPGLAAALGVGHAAQRDDLEPAGVEFGTQPGAGAPVDGEGGGEGGRAARGSRRGCRRPAGHGRRAYVSSCSTTAGQVPRGPHVGAVAQVDDPARVVAQPHQNPPRTCVTGAFARASARACVQYGPSGRSLPTLPWRTDRVAMTPPSVGCLPSDTSLNRLPDQRRTAPCDAVTGANMIL